MLSILLLKARRFLSHPRFIQLWFVPLWILLGLAKLLIVAVPFRWFAPLLGQSSGVAPSVPLLKIEQERRALQIGQAVQIAARYTPWDSNCFPQAVVARLLLDLYEIPYALYFGLMRDPQSRELKAHAWVAAGKIRVTGGAGFRGFTAVGAFVSPK
jgi:hypothetical protein